jgi:hypothetical protein
LTQTPRDVTFLPFIIDEPSNVNFWLLIETVVGPSLGSTGYASTHVCVKAVGAEVLFPIP